MIRSTFLIASFSALLGGCMSNPVPEGYTGPVARFQDTMVKDGNGVDFFYLAKVDGRAVENSLEATTQANKGMGAYMKPVVIGRNVLAQPQTFTISGRTHYAAPILAIVQTVHGLSGEIRFAPVAGHVYDVKGVFGDTYSAVWLEDEQTHAVIDHKIEVNGPATLGLFDK